MASETDSVQEFCRLCQHEEGTIPLKDNPELINHILSILHIKVDTDHNCFPHNICHSCTNIIFNTATFIETVQGVNEKLNQLLQKESSSEDLVTIYCEPDHTEEVAVESDVDSLNEISDCFKVTIQKSLLNEINSGTVNNLKCPICLETYQNTDSFRVHRMGHVELYCDNCHEVFDSNIAKQHHSCKESFIYDKVLNKCEGSNGSKTQIEINLNRLNNTALPNCVLPCEYIEKPILDKSIPIDHIKINKNECKSSDDRRYLCETCGKTFRTKNSLSCHEKIHLGQKLHKCSKCNLAFTLRGSLLTHNKRHHEGQKFYCSKCTKQFLSKDTLIRHEKTHTGIREFQCKECFKAFYTSKELKKHQRYHQGIKLFKCDQCFKSFFERHHLIVHVRRHTGERPFLCTISGCEKSFFEKQKLKRHIKQCHMK